jgi:hypothetical protein
MGGLKEDKRPYNEKRAVLGNLGLLLWILLGTVTVWFYYSLGAWFFLFFALFAVYGVVRKKLCKTCAYCKACTQGWGKLVELVFGKAELGGLSARSLMGLIVFVNVLLTIVPAAFIVVSNFQVYVEFKIAVLLLLVLFSIFCGTSKRKLEFMKN